MVKFLTAIVALGCAVGLCVLALWVVPPADPIDYIQFKLNHRVTDTVGITTAEAATICPPEMSYYRAQCVDRLTHPHFAAWQSRSRFLSEVQTIPDEDCARMADTLKAREQLSDDGALIKNARGGFNCDFARFGLVHLVRSEHAGTDQCSPTYDVNITLAMSAPDFDVCVRKTYVTRPVYNLSHTRFSIEVGDGPNGARCLYSRILNGRLTDRWRLESCPETWDF